MHAYTPTYIPTYIHAYTHARARTYTSAHISASQYIAEIAELKVIIIIASTEVTQSRRYLITHYKKNITIVIIFIII